MNQNDLQRKRARRQADRKEARARARRREVDVQNVKAKELATRLRPKAHMPEGPGFFGKLLGTTLGGAQIVPDQPDAEAAAILGGSDL